MTEHGAGDAEAGEDERNEGDEDVERDRAGEEEDVVLAGLLINQRQEST